MANHIISTLPDSGESNLQLALIGRDAQGHPIYIPLTENLIELSQRVHQLAVVTVGFDWSGQVWKATIHLPFGDILSCRHQPLSNLALVERIAAFLNETARQQRGQS